MPVKSGNCIKTGALVKVLEYGVAQRADVFLCGTSVIIKFADDIQLGQRTEEPTGHEVIIGLGGYYSCGSDEKPTIVVPMNQFAGEVRLRNGTAMNWEFNGERPFPSAEQVANACAVDVESFESAIKTPLDGYSAGINAATQHFHDRFVKGCQ